MNKVRDPNIDDVIRLSDRNQELCDKLNNLTSKCNTLYDTCIMLNKEIKRYFENKKKSVGKTFENTWSDERKLDWW